MSIDAPDASNPVVFASVFNQNWENVRHVKNERISFMNAYSLITAGVLTLLQNLHTSDLIRTALLLFMALFSVFGFLTSLRLKAELEECLEKIGVMTSAAKASDFVALGQLKSRPWHYPKFRWLFPLFFAMTTTGFLSYRLQDRRRTDGTLTKSSGQQHPNAPELRVLLRRTNLVTERLGFVLSNHRRSDN